MKLVTFRHDGAIRHGRLTEHHTIVLPLGDGDLTSVLGRSAGAAGPMFPVADVELLAPLPRPGKLIAVATDHRETGAGEGRSPRLFLRPPTCIAGPGADIPLPSAGGTVHATGGLAVVIGVSARDVPAGSAMDVVGGYVVSAGLSTHAGDPPASFFDWVAGTWSDGFAPMGPWLVTPDEVPDPQALPVTVAVNGERRQNGSTKDMPFPVAELVSFASTLMTLEPGDVLMTGGPPAIREHLAVGDELSVTIGGLGTLVNHVVTR